MRIIGVDLHTRQQSIAMLNTETGEVIEKILKHDSEELRRFYASTCTPSPRRDRSYRISS